MSLLVYSCWDLQHPGSVASATSLSPLPPEPADYDRGATVDIPLDSSKVTRKFFNIMCNLRCKLRSFTYIGFEKEGEGASGKRG